MSFKNKYLYSICKMTLAVGVMAGVHAHAQNYPSKPVRILVTSAPGGSVDTVARLFGARLTEALGQQVLADNRPSAGGILAASIVAKAPPDGYTLILGTAPSFAVNVSLHKSLPYDPVKDFAPVSLLASQDLVMLIHPSVPAKSVKDVVAIARQKPGQLSYASAGVGAMSHLSGELLKKIMGIDLLHVPYRGSVSFMLDVVSGQVSMTFNSLLSSRPFVTSGKVRALAVTGTKRSPVFPQLPTMQEAGVADFESSTWYGVLAPAATPPDIIKRLNGELLSALKHPEVIDRLHKDGLTIIGMPSAPFSTFIASEIVKWRQVIRGASIEPT